MDADYVLEGERGVVRLWCKDSKGRAVLAEDRSFSPYFYIMPRSGRSSPLRKRLEKLDEKETGIKIIGTEEVGKTWEGKIETVVKVVIENPRKIPDMRNLVKDWDDVKETYEYDIQFFRRYLIDKGIRPSQMMSCETQDQNPDQGILVQRKVSITGASGVESIGLPDVRMMAFDTEWVEEASDERIVMISVACNDGYRRVLAAGNWGKAQDFVETFPEEKGMMQRFMQILQEKDPDFLVGYNSDGFDIPKMKEKAAKLKMKISLGRDGEPVHVVRRGNISSVKAKGRVLIDAYDFIDHILSSNMKSEVMTLDEVSKELLGEGKRELDYKEMLGIWSSKEGLDKMADYCLQDSNLTLMLGELILPQIFALSGLTGMLPFDTCRTTYSQLVEHFLMRSAFADNVLIPNRPRTDEIQQRRMAPSYKGAIVIEPEKGIHNDIMVLDFRSLYPTIIVSHNIDPWTFNLSPCKSKSKTPESDSYFCLDEKGFIPRHIEEIIESRRKIKDKMKNVERGSAGYMLLENQQYALKIIANAAYGYYGYFGSKWYKRECGSAAAAWGRHYITKVIEMAKSEGFDVIYGDTDSLMARLPKKDTQARLKEAGVRFAEKVNESLPGIIELEFRDLYESGIFVARQKDDEGAKKRYALMDYHGKLEVRGFETVRRDWCELSKRLQREILVTILKDKDPAKAVRLVRDTVKKIKEGKVAIEDLTILEQITRPLAEYEQIGPHVSAAKKSVEKGRPIVEGMVIGFVIIRGSGSISSRAEPVEDVKPGQYDPDYYIEHQVLPASMRVLKALGYSEEEVLVGKVQKKLGAFTTHIHKK